MTIEISRDDALSRLVTHLATHRYRRSVAGNYQRLASRFLNHLESERKSILTYTAKDLECYLGNVTQRRGSGKGKPASTCSLRQHRASISMMLCLVSPGWNLARLSDKENADGLGLLKGYREWMSDVRGLAASTLKRRIGEARILITWLLRFRQGSPALIAPADFDAYIEYRKATLSRVTLANVFASVISFLSYLNATKQSTLDLNVFCRDRPRVYERENPPRAFSSKEVDLLTKMSGQDRSRQAKRDRAMFLLVKTYGLRGSEATRLQLNDVNFRKNILNIYHSKTRAHSELPLTDAVGSALIDYLKNERPTSKSRNVFLCARAPYGPLTTEGAVTRMIRRYFPMKGRAPLDHRGAHALRHSRALSMLRAKVPLKVIGDVLGHRSPRSTLTYLSLATDDLRNVSLELPRGNLT